MSGIPEHLWRFPTRTARASLNQRFGLPLNEAMQDWEWEVAHPGRVEEFITAYESEQLTDDERFSLMETIIQSFAESEYLIPHVPVAQNPRWHHVLNLLDENIGLHIHSVWYWAMEEHRQHLDGTDVLPVTPSIRVILDKHRVAFEHPHRQNRQ